MKKDLELEIMKFKVHAESPYNDGWTREMYQELYNQALKKLDRKNKRLEKKNGKVRL